MAWGLKKRNFSLMHAENQLIARLPAEARTSLLAICDKVELVQRAVLVEEAAPATHVYFPTEGAISLTATVKGGAGVEVGMIGSEGVLGAQVGLGTSTAPFQSRVQGAGTAWRAEAGAFRAEVARSGPLCQTLTRYLYVVTVQLGTSAACMHFHQIGPRLARWLLMSQDRTQSDTLQVTHEYLAYTLGVRRVGITAAAGELQRAGLIRYHRGVLRVFDRGGLEQVSCDCYAVNEKVYDQLLV